MASFARPKISSQFLRVNGILKFALRYKFIKRETRGGLNYGLLAVASLRSKAVPLSPFLNPLKSRTLEVHASVLCSACGLSSGKCRQILKIYEQAYHASKFSGEFYET